MLNDSVNCVGDGRYFLAASGGISIRYGHGSVTLTLALAFFRI
jgi:hypothetical protein